MQNESKSSTVTVKQSTVNDFVCIAREVSQISVFAQSQGLLNIV